MNEIITIWFALGFGPSAFVVVIDPNGIESSVR